MAADLRGRDLIGDLDFTKSEVEQVLELAWDLKKQRAESVTHPLLRDKVLAMLFFFTSIPTGLLFPGTCSDHICNTTKPKIKNGNK